jgi:hypothetical protein
MRPTLLIALLLLLPFSASAAEAAKKGRTVEVSDAAQLKAAFADLKDDDTILIADGLYHPDRVMMLNKNRVTVRGKSGDREKVILDGDQQGSGQMLWFTQTSDSTLADVTIKNIGSNAVSFKAENGPIVKPTVRNVHFINVWERSLKGTKNTDEAGCPRGGLIEGCLIETEHAKNQDDAAGGDYIAGIDMMGLRGWTFRGNTFKNINGRNGGARGAIFLWVDSKDVLIENNLFINCDRGIALGNPSGTQDMDGAIVRNNVIINSGDKAMEIVHVKNCIIYNNTVWNTNAGAGRCQVFDDCTKIQVCNNLIRGNLQLDSKDVKAEHNEISALDGAFVAPDGGDFHLTPAGVTLAGGKGVKVPELKLDGVVVGKPVDIDKDAFGDKVDLGADQHR